MSLEPSTHQLRSWRWSLTDKPTSSLPVHIVMIVLISPRSSLSIVLVAAARVGWAMATGHDTRCRREALLYVLLLRPRLYEGMQAQKHGAFINNFIYWDIYAFVLVFFPFSEHLLPSISSDVPSIYIFQLSEMSNFLSIQRACRQ